VRTRVSRTPEVRAALRADLLVPLVRELGRRDEAMAGIAIIVIGELAPIGDAEAIAAIRRARRQSRAASSGIDRRQQRSFVRVCDIALHNLGDAEVIERFNQELLHSKPAVQAELLDNLARRRSIHLHLPALRILIDDESVIEPEYGAGLSYRICDRVVSTLRFARLPGLPSPRHPDLRTLSADEYMNAYRDRVRQWLNERIDDESLQRETQ